MHFKNLPRIVFKILSILIANCLCNGESYALMFTLKHICYERNWIAEHFESCSIESAKKHLDNGHCINLQSPAGKTFLMQAIIDHQIDTVNFILDHEPDVNLTNNLGETALHYAAQAGLEEVIQRLLSIGANPNCKNWLGWTPLMHAEMYEKTNVFQQLLRCPQININVQDCSGYTVLIYAALNNKCDIAAMLLAHPSIDIHIVEDLGCTADLFIHTPEMKGEFRFYYLRPFLNFLQSCQIQSPTTRITPLPGKKISHMVKILENPDLTRFLCKFIA